MKIAADKRLFWFLKDDVELDLDIPSVLDMYVQQVLSRGISQDVKVLFERIGALQVKEVFMRVKSFLPKEVRLFWEDYFGNT